MGQISEQRLLVSQSTLLILLRWGSSQNNSSISINFDSFFFLKLSHYVLIGKIPSDSDAADKINADGIHILINMNGYTTG